jgi:hypothetical protein
MVGYSHQLGVEMPIPANDLGWTLPMEIPYSTSSKCKSENGDDGYPDIQKAGCEVIAERA